MDEKTQHKYSYLHFFVGIQTLYGAYFPACKRFQQNELTFEGKRQKMLARVRVFIALEKEEKQLWRFHLVPLAFYSMDSPCLSQKEKRRRHSKMCEKITQALFPQATLQLQGFRTVTAFVEWLLSDWPWSWTCLIALEKEGKQLWHFYLAIYFRVHFAFHKGKKTQKMRDKMTQELYPHYKDFCVEICRVLLVWRIPWSLTCSIALEKEGKQLWHFHLAIWFTLPFTK